MRFSRDDVGIVPYVLQTVKIALRFSRDDVGIVPYNLQTVKIAVRSRTVSTVILFHQCTDFFAEDNLLNVVGVIKPEHAYRD